MPHISWLKANFAMDIYFISDYFSLKMKFSCFCTAEGFSGFWN